jgi:tripartite-type tricarboxylate transporter receptor subunit TctC
MRHAPRSFLALLTLGLLAGGLPPLPAEAQSQAQAWPQRPVRFVLTLGAGSGTDIGGRLLADRLTKKWGMPVVIENKRW